jgi:NitT/TauT family transport system substrate-binding protein
MNGCQEKQTVRILTPDGIPSIALGGLMDEWDIGVVSGADLITSELLKADYDIIIAPLTAAAKTYILGNTAYQCHAVLTTGNTYLVKEADGSDAFDLEGKKLGAYGQNNIPDLLLQMYLGQNEMNPFIQYEASVNDVVSNQVLASEPSDFFILAEPFLSLLEIQHQKELTILDLQTELDILPFVPQAGVFIKKGTVNTVFLNELEENIRFLKENPMEYAEKLLLISPVIAPAFTYLGEEVIRSSLPRSSIVYYPIEEYQSTVELFFETVNAFNVNILGGEVPDEAFYGS